MTNRDSGSRLHASAGSVRKNIGVVSAAAFVCAVLAGAPHGAFAQQATQSTADAQSQSSVANSSDQLQEVVVTATRRTENIQSVPISITAFTKAQMDIQGVKTVDDIARLSPSVQFSRGGGLGTAIGGTSLSIRGIGSGAGSATVGVYIDDTPIQVGATIASGSFSDDAFPMLFDVERVEVLNGPQGTLFGSGSEGGTIRFITTPPNMNSASVYARAGASYTQYGAPSYEVGVAGGMPIIPGVLGFRASVYNKHTGGYVDSVDYYTGQVTAPNANSEDGNAVRLALGWQPIDGLMITPSFFFQHIVARASAGFALRSDGYFTPGNPVFNQPWGDVAKGDYVNLERVPQWGDQRLSLPALKIQYDFSNMELISDTSYYTRTEDNRSDFTNFEVGTWAGELFPSDPNVHALSILDQGNDYFTQEIRLQSTNKQSRFSWLVGLFYSKNRTYQGNAVADPFLGKLINEATGIPCPPGPNNLYPTCVDAIFGMPLQDGTYTFIGDSQIHEKQKAVFAQANYKLPWHLIATVGVRYAKMSNTFDNAEGGPVTGVTFPTFDHGSVDANATTPKYMLSYNNDKGLLVYASATKGFRNGGANAPLNNIKCQAQLKELGLKTPDSYEPDSVWSYEVGSKWTTDDHRLSLDWSLFEIKWTNMINNISLNQCTLSFTTNIGDSQSRGFDLAVNYRPIDPLLVGMNADYQFIKSTETIKISNGVVVNGQTFQTNYSTKGDALPGSLPVINAHVQYSFVMKYPMYFRADYNYTGPNAFENNPADIGYLPQQLPGGYLSFYRSPGFSTTDVRLGANLGDWEVSLYCDNLFNNQPLLGKGRASVGFAFPPAYTGYLTAGTLRPRTAGVQAIFRF